MDGVPGVGRSDLDGSVVHFGSRDSERCPATVGAFSPAGLRQPDEGMVGAQMNTAAPGSNQTGTSRPLWRAVSYKHLRAHETVLELVCRLPLEKKKTKTHTHTHLSVS